MVVNAMIEVDPVEDAPSYLGMMMGKMTDSGRAMGGHGAYVKVLDFHETDRLINTSCSFPSSSPAWLTFISLEGVILLAAGWNRVFAVHQCVRP